jgi:hypothetical protein
MFTFGSDISCAPDLFPAGPGSGLVAWLMRLFRAAGCVLCAVVWEVFGRAGDSRGTCALALGLWRRRGGGEGGEGLAAPMPGPGGQAGGGAAGIVFLAGAPGGEDALVADGGQAGEPEHERCQACPRRRIPGQAVRPS